VLVAGAVARRQLAGTTFADVRWVAETGSTNSDLVALARAGAAHGTVLVADHQTAGRGRRGRSWAAPPETALLVSVLLRLPQQTASLASMAVAVAAAEAVAGMAGAAPRLKWPNDLVWPGDGTADDRKLAGILAEADWPAAGSPAAAPADVAVVVGMGLNVVAPPDPPPELAGIAVAVDEIAAVTPPPSREDLLVAWLRALDPWVAGLVAGRSEAMLDAWRARSATIGQAVAVDLGTEQFGGIAEGVDGDGRLVVRLADGASRVVAAGDVVHVRPA
jgi:BirA family biotin operon repressor/biotin-[acetyl-CoA-carboxylase] ligase